jgi:hypothetical protein
MDSPVRVARANRYVSEKATARRPPLAVRQLPYLWRRDFR